MLYIVCVRNEQYFCALQKKILHSQHQKTVIQKLDNSMISALFVWVCKCSTFQMVGCTSHFQFSNSSKLDHLTSKFFKVKWSRLAINIKNRTGYPFCFQYTFKWFLVFKWSVIEVISDF